MSVRDQLEQIAKRVRAASTSETDRARMKALYESVCREVRFGEPQPEPCVSARDYGDCVEDPPLSLSSLRYEELRRLGVPVVKISPHHIIIVGGDR